MKYKQVDLRAFRLSLGSVVNLHTEEDRQKETLTVEAEIVGGVARLCAYFYLTSQLT